MPLIAVLTLRRSGSSSRREISRCSQPLRSAFARFRLFTCETAPVPEVDNYGQESSSPSQIPIFSLQKRLTFRRVDIVWKLEEYLDNNAAANNVNNIADAFNERYSLPCLCPSPVPKSVERKAEQVLIRPGEFATGHQLKIDRMREIAAVCAIDSELQQILGPLLL